MYVVIHLQSHYLMETSKKLLGHWAGSKINCGLLKHVHCLVNISEAEFKEFKPRR